MGNEVDRAFSASTTPGDFARRYFAHFLSVMGAMDPAAVARAIEIFLDARARGACLFFVGNGGSAATATHFANDVAIGTRASTKPFRAVSLTDNNAIITAIANDDGYEQVFVKQLQALMQPGDVLVAISASGNSPNLVRAVEYANALGNITVGFTGFDGGRLKQLCKLAVHVATERGEYGPVESAHGVLVHLIGNYLLKCVERERLEPRSK
jgi:D-sedoheptulose 7-phosphate isomerase